MGSGGWGRQEARRSADAFRAVRQGERARAGRSGPPGAEADRSRLSPRHCWVTDPPAAPGRWPGVVLEWRPSGERWEGRVVVVVGSGRGVGVIEAWLDEEQLTPA
jgi:hypothetical protein